MKTPRRVFVCSPFRDANPIEQDKNIRIAQELCLRAVVLEGVAAFAPHAFYPLFLDDSEADQRELEVAAGLAWLAVAEELWWWAKDGKPTQSMAAEILHARNHGIVVRGPEELRCWDGVGEDS